jgi:DMSO reductase family type II enzyme chaperone
LALAGLPGTRSLLGLLDSVEEGFRATSRRELARQYVALFSHGWEGASLPYETEYTAPHAFQKQTELADIAGFYRAFGLQWETQGHERPDHLSLELEFMYYLALKEAHALAQGADEGVAVCVDAQRSFLRDHLGQWLGAFRRALANRGTETVYARLARLVEAWVVWDSRQQGVKLSRVPAAPVSAEPPEEGGCPYSDGGCSAVPAGHGGSRQVGGHARS